MHVVIIFIAAIYQRSRLIRIQTAIVAIVVGKTFLTELEAAMLNSMPVVNGLTLVLLPGNLIIKAVSAEAQAAQNVVAHLPSFLSLETAFRSRFPTFSSSMSPKSRR